MTGIGNAQMGELQRAGEPVRRPEAFAEDDSRPEDGMALCLSGGGYRAMVFHLGVLWRLNDAGLLAELQRISSVSGGSITAGVLGANWSELAFDGDGVAGEFEAKVVEPIRSMARLSIDISSVLTGAVLPFTSIGDRVIKAYERHLFGDRTLQDLPEEPRFVFNATNLQSGVLMRMSRPYVADYRVGRIEGPDLRLAVVVAASSAFPPFLSPCTVDLGHERWSTDEGNDLAQTDGFRGEIPLTDGGVYDNLGLETAWKRYRTILVSDAGGHVDAEPHVPGDWARGLERILHLLDSQVRALRKRQVIAGFRAGDRLGMYAGIRSDPANFPVRDPFPVDARTAQALASIPTRLSAMDDVLQERLVNWGYAICDAGIRGHDLAAGPRPDQLPYPCSAIDREP